MKSPLLIAFLLFVSFNLRAGNDQLVVQQGHTEDVLFLSVDPQGKTYATASRDKTVKVWEIRSGKLIKTITGFSFYVTKVGYSPEGNFLYMRGDLGTCKVYSTSDFVEVSDKFYDDPFPITQLNFGVNDDMLLFGNKGSAFIVNTKSWKKYLLSARVAGEVDHVVFDAATKKVSVRAKGGNPTEVDVSSILAKEEFNIGRIPSEHYPYRGELKENKIYIYDKNNSLIAVRTQPRVNVPSNAVFSPDKKFIAISFESSGDVVLFSVFDHAIRRINTGEKEIRAIQFSPDSKNLIVGWGSVLKLVNVFSLEEKSMYSHNGFITCAEISKDNKWLVSGSADGQLKVFDLTKNILASEFKAGGIVSALSIHPKGKMVAVAEDGHVMIYKMPVLKEDKIVIKGTGTRSTDFSGDGKFLVAQDAKTKRVMLYETGKDEPAKSFRDPSEHKTRSESAIKKQLFPVAFSTKGQYLISMGEEWVMHLRNTNDFAAVELKGHSSWANSFSFSSDDQWLISTSDDGSIRVWDVAGARNIVTMVFNDKDFVIANENNYYFTSKGGYDLVGFYQNGTVYPFEQFDLIMNRPDKVLLSLGSSNSELISALEFSWKRRMEKMGISSSSTGGTPPTCRIVNRDKIGIQTKTTELNLQLEAKSSGAKLDRLMVWINEVPIWGRNGFSLKKLNTGEWNKSISILLADGTNQIDVAVLDANGLESNRERIITDRPSPAQKPVLYYVGIGSGTFSNASFNLRYPGKDVTDMKSFLELQKPANYSAVKTLLITDEKVNRSSLKEVKTFLATAGRNDQVILFFAGHGVLDAGFNYFLSTHDMNFNSPDQNGIEYSQLENVLDSIAPLKKLFLIDACHSGEVDKDEITKGGTNEKSDDLAFRSVGDGFTVKHGMNGRTSTELLKELFADVRRGTGATIISSAGSAEFAMESGEWKNGLFTYVLLNGLKSGDADLDKNGHVSVTELLRYTGTVVDELSKGKQHPTTRSENVSLDFDLN
ncbi:MAG: caspase family protein [Flavobacteriales bacterium]|nr:caspase family protein [Flavobacteriales bacterium]